MAALAPALTAISEALEADLPDIFEAIVKDAGDAAAIHLAKLLAPRAAALAEVFVIRAAAPAAAKIEMEFDVTNPRAKAWIDAHSTELIKDIDSTTRDALKAIITSAFEDGRTVDEIAEDIYDLVESEARADRIARTETMFASNEGQSLLWDQAVEDGLLTGKEKQVWIVTPDDRLCPICEPMDGVTVALDGEFDVDGEGIDGPPAHPNCRCTVGLVL